MSNSIPFEKEFLHFSSSVYDVIEKTESTCVSPYSLISALLLLMVGANGRTKTQISSAIFNDSKLPDNKKFEKYRELSDQLIHNKGDELEFKVANKMFVNKKFTLRKKVQRQAKEFFLSDIGYKDFTKPKQAASFMNSYTAKHTNNKIKDLISWKWINSMTAMVLVNAVYFKGEWKTKFDPSNTKKEDFFVSKQKTVKVNMMNVKQSVLYVSQDDFSAISLPYKGDNFDMVFILPKENDGLHQIEEKLSSDLIKSVNSNLKTAMIQISVPKFAFESEFDLKLVLPQLGIEDIFNQANADFSTLLQEQTDKVYVSRAIHKVFIEVNEKGTEAAAATAIVAQVRSANMQLNFVANHPFLFYIRNLNTGMILFIGRYSPV
ncbi:serine protease inhibitor 2.1-like [Mytilus californianus]|uniref:serine protease inhibitor 2.1-like n=1 Tax=Mytilus californianus TaxID=6549 RepID=UPI002247E3C9|nr:serine protease inhibitor 2.1-like [Mytilus californianus]